MTSGASSEEKEVDGQSTNWVKLKIKTAFTWYSRAIGVCAGNVRLLINNTAAVKQRMFEKLFV